jgi:hypothetical protein
MLRNIPLIFPCQTLRSEVMFVLTSPSTMPPPDNQLFKIKINLNTVICPCYQMKILQKLFDFLEAPVSKSWSLIS